MERVNISNPRVIGVIGLEDPQKMLAHIEDCGRVSYKTQDRIKEGTAEKFVEMIIKNGHESVLEHCVVTVKLECDRATAQQLTRHRLASFTIESQRYCNYGLGRFGHAIRVADPNFRTKDGKERNERAYEIWEKCMKTCEEAYFDLLEKAGTTPEDARSVLSMSTMGTVAMTANLREWRHVMKLRLDPHAQHNIRDLMRAILNVFKEKIPCVFADIE